MATETHTSAFLPPHLLSGLGGLALVARTAVRGFVAGAHPSPLRGSGDEFARHRSYQQGDDVRHVDWKLFARSDRLFVREFRERSNLRAFLVVDHSASMGYADAHGVSKLRYASMTAAALGFLMLRAGDAVGLATFGSAGEVALPARGRRGQLAAILRRLEALRPAGGAGAVSVLDRLGDALPRHGRLVVLSDLLEADAQGSLVDTLGRFRARGDEVIVLRVLTPEEAGDAPLPPGVYFDPEAPAAAVAAAPGADAGYARRVAAYYAELAARLRGKGVEYVALSTTDPVEWALARWAASRGG